MKKNKIFKIVCLLVLPQLFAAGVEILQEKQAEAAPVQNREMISEFTPVELTDSSLKKGLHVVYYLDFFKRDLSYIDEMVKGEFESFEGKPITHLDHQFGKNEVFGSGTNRGVALRMSGYLKFPRKGIYTLQALSNDGIFVYLENTLIISDPKQHSDRLSDIADVSVTKAGWIPVRVDYFQRKGTATIKLMWKPPGGPDYVAVPASSYGHIN